MSNLLKRCLWGIYFFSLLLPTSIQAHALQQEPIDIDEEIDATYDLEPEILSNYASLTVNWGINFLRRAPKDMDLTFWGSRLAGANLLYNIPIKNSHFTVGCGINLSHADYSFKVDKKDSYTLDQTTTSPKKTIIRPASKVKITPAGVEIKKSVLSIWYTDFIAELRFNSNREEPQEGFFVAVGGHIGYQFPPTVSIQYEEDKEEKTRTMHERFNLSKVRYGVLARMGWGRFGAFYHQTLSPLFNDQGPDTPNNKSILPFSIGVSVNLL